MIEKRNFMSIINLTVPSFPYFITAGSALYRPGDLHRSRSSIGVFDLIFVEYGELYITENNRPYTLSVGDYLILSPTGKHFSEKPVKEETLYHWLHFGHDGEYIISEEVISLTKKSASLYVPSKSIISIPANNHLTSQQQQTFLHLHKELSSLLFDNYKHSFTPISQQPYSAIVTQQLMLQLLDMLQLHEKTQRKTRLAKSVMEYLRKNYTQNISLEMLSELFHFHPAHIIRTFKEEYGITPIEALNTIRFHNAAQLLTESDKTILEIAEQTGFTSASYFSRVFKQKSGMTPRDYRVKRQGNNSEWTQDSQGEERL